MVTFLLPVLLASLTLAQQGQPPPNQQQYQQQQGQQQQQYQGQPGEQQQFQQPQQAHQPNQQQQANQAAVEAAAAAARQFAADNELNDADHIKTHLNGQMEVDTSKMTPEQLQFHYFTMHDLDKSNALDGIELIKAITHWHGDDPSTAPPKIEDSELEDMIDSILKDDDFNNDGFIDYPEFLRSQAARAGNNQQPPPPPPNP